MMFLRIQQLVHDVNRHAPVELLISRVMTPRVSTWWAFHNLFVDIQKFPQSIDLSLIAVSKRFEVYTSISIFYKQTKDKFSFVSCSAHHIVQLFCIHVLDYHSGSLLNTLQPD